MAASRGACPLLVSEAAGRRHHRDVRVDEAAWDLDVNGAEDCAAAVRAAGGTAIAAGVDAAQLDAVTAAWRSACERLGPVAHLAAVGGPPSFGERSFMDGGTTAIDCVRIPTETWLAEVVVEQRAAVYLSSVQGPRSGAGVPWYTVGSRRSTDTCGPSRRCARVASARTPSCPTGR